MSEFVCDSEPFAKMWIVGVDDDGYRFASPAIAPTRLLSKNSAFEPKCQIGSQARVDRQGMVSLRLVVAKRWRSWRFHLIPVEVPGDYPSSCHRLSSRQYFSFQSSIERTTIKLLSLHSI